jgi:hypothetical protein
MISIKKNWEKEMDNKFSELEIKVIDRMISITDEMRNEDYPRTKTHIVYSPSEGGYTLDISLKKDGEGREICLLGFEKLGENDAEVYRIEGKGHEIFMKYFNFISPFSHWKESEEQKE